MKYLSGGMHFKKTPQPLPLLHGLLRGCRGGAAREHGALAAVGLLPGPRPAALCLACKRQAASCGCVQRPLGAVLGPCKRHLLCSISPPFSSASSLLLC